MYLTSAPKTAHCTRNQMSSCQTVSTARLLLDIHTAVQDHVVRGAKVTFVVMALTAATSPGNRWKDKWSVYAYVRRSHDEASIHIWQRFVQCTTSENAVLSEVHVGRTRNVNRKWPCIPTLSSLFSSTTNVSLSFPSRRSSFSKKCITSKSRRPRRINP